MTMDPAFEKDYQMAQESFDDKRYDEAERLFLHLLERNPKGYADVFNSLGLINSEKGLLERAATYFEKALAINPRYTEASLNLTVTYNELQKFSEAEEVFNRAASVIRSEPASLDPYIQGKLANEHGKLGDSYYNLGMYDQALEEYDKAQGIRPDFVDVITKIGVTLKERGDLEEAIQTFTRAKQVHPKYLPAFINLGLTYFKKGQRDLAVKEWTSAQKLDPANRAVQVYLNLAKKP